MNDIDYRNVRLGHWPATAAAAYPLRATSSAAFFVRGAIRYRVII